MEEEVTSDDDVYEVEKIVDNVMVGGKTYYRVRWKNYGEEGDTWEPKENLLSCEDLLNNYIRVQTEKSTGLVLPGDVFTPGEGNSESENEQSSNKESKKDGKKKPAQNKKKQEQVKTKKKARKVVVHKSSSSSDESSDEEPQLKDDFWEKLKEGKIDVFASDLYSKVKARRPPEKEVDVPKQIPHEITGKGKKRSGKKKSSKDNAGGEGNSATSSGKDQKEEKGKKAKQSSSSKTKKSAAEKETVAEEKEKAAEKKEVPDAVTESGPSVSSEDDSKEKEPDDESTVVLQYLEEEMRNSKGKSNKKTKDGKSSKKQKDADKNEEQATENTEQNTKEKSQSKQSTSALQNISKPNIVLEKLDFTDEASKDVSVGVETIVKVEKMDVVSEDEEKTVKKKKKKKSKVDVQETEKDKEQPLQFSENKKETTKPTNELPAESPSAFSALDAFSAQLRESDAAVSERIMRRKDKGKKLKSLRIVSPLPEKEKTPSHTVTPSPGSSVLEMLSQEIEQTASLNAQSDATHESTPKDVSQNKFGFESAKVASVPTTKDAEQSEPECLPEMLEFLKIKVTFELDEVSLKEIERHHEMGEPPCRLEKDITNGEFRQCIRTNNFEMIHEALKSKKMMYNLEHTDSVWMTQLMVASAAGFNEIVKILAHHGAKVNARTKNGQTALMFAAEKGHDIVCRILLAYGAYVNLQMTSGETALIKAAKAGHTMIVRYLLQAGADPLIKSAHGSTALELAERYGHSILSGLVKDHETNITAHVNECIHRECHNLGIRTIGLPILAARLYNVRECPLIHIAFNCVLQNLPPNQGLIAFAVHGMITSGLSIKCRMRGPCHVQAVTLNSYVMTPLMPGKSSSEENSNFMTNLVWKTGQNSLRLFVSQDPLSSEKVFVSIFQCGFVA